MKPVVFTNKPSFLNPSYLGADRLWADGSDELIGREPKVEDYHGI